MSVEVSELVLDARYGDAEAVEQAVAQGVDVNGKSHGGSTALLMASANGHLEIVRGLEVGFFRSDGNILEMASQSPTHPFYFLLDFGFPGDTGSLRVPNVEGDIISS